MDPVLLSQTVCHAPGWLPLTSLVGSPQLRERDFWKSKDPTDKRAKVGGGQGHVEKKQPLQQELNEPCTSFRWAVVHPSLWVYNLSAGTGPISGSRTLKKIGQAWGKQGHVE